MKRFGLTLLLLAICQSASAQLPNRILNSERRLPTSFYTAIADPTVHMVNVPRGRYNLNNGYIATGRSDLTVDWNGSEIILRPTEGVGSNYTPIIVASPITDLNVGSPARAYAHLTGTITPSATTVTWVDGAVPSVGEEIEICFGINAETDPAEYHSYFRRTVSAVSGNQVTVSVAFGETVPAYANLAALKAATDSSNYFKIDDASSNAWDGPGNHKGLGHDGIAYRFTGGRMAHDVTHKNFRLKVELPSGLASYPEGSYLLFPYHFNGATFSNFCVDNIVGSMIHQTSGYNTTVEKFTITGKGYAKAGGSGLASGQACDSWGAVNDTYQDGVFYNTTNINGIVSEIYVNGRTIDNLQWVNAVADASLTDVDQWYFFQHACVCPVAPSIDDISIWLTGTSDATLISDSTTASTLGDLTFAGAYFPTAFNFSTRTISGTLTVNSIPYGPLVTEVKQLSITHNNGSARHVYPPSGFYKKLRIRFTTVGGVSGITDGFGNSYAGTLTPNTWVDVTAFATVQPGASGGGTYQNYLDNLRFDLPYSSASNSVMELDVEYYPATGAVWSVQ